MVLFYWQINSLIDSTWPIRLSTSLNYCYSALNKPGITRIAKNKIVDKLGLSWAKHSTDGAEFIGLGLLDFPTLKLNCDVILDLI